jgi:hypothetical protein
MGNHFMDPQKAKPGIVSLTSAEPAVVKLADSESVFVSTNKEPVIGSAMKVSVAVSAKQRPDSVGVKASESIPHASEKAPDTKSNVPEQVANATPDVPKSASDSQPSVSELAIEYPAPGVLRADAELPQTAPLPPHRPPPRPVIHRTHEEICHSVTEAAQKNRLPAPFFIRLLFQESRFKPGAISPAGALGIAQFMPETSASMGVENPFDPLEAIPASARLLRALIEQFGNLGLAAAAYNAGPTRIQDWLSSGKKLPKETKNYVHTVTGRPVVTWKKAAAAEHGEQRLPRLAPCQKAAGLYAWNGPEHIPVPTAAPARAQAKAKAVEKAPAKTKAASKKHDTKSAHERGATQLAARGRKHRHRHRHKDKDKERHSRLAER